MLCHKLRTDRFFYDTIYLVKIHCKRIAHWRIFRVFPYTVNLLIHWVHQSLHIGYCKLFSLVVLYGISWYHIVIHYDSIQYRHWNTVYYWRHVVYTSAFKQSQIWRISWTAYYISSYIILCFKQFFIWIYVAVKPWCRCCYWCGLNHIIYTWFCV